MVVPNNHGFFLLKNDHFRVFWGYRHLRKTPIYLEPLPSMGLVYMDLDWFSKLMTPTLSRPANWDVKVQQEGCDHWHHSLKGRPTV